MFVELLCDADTRHFMEDGVEAAAEYACAPDDLVAGAGLYRQFSRLPLDTRIHSSRLSLSSKDLSSAFRSPA